MRPTPTFAHSSARLDATTTNQRDFVAFDARAAKRDRCSPAKAVYSAKLMDPELFKSTYQLDMAAKASVLALLGLCWVWVVFGLC